jgi:hypothetical protein
VLVRVRLAAERITGQRAGSWESGKWANRWLHAKSYIDDEQEKGEEDFNGKYLHGKGSDSHYIFFSQSD